MRKYVSAIKNKSRFAHHVINRLVIIASELVPLRHHSDSMSPAARIQSSGTGDDQLARIIGVLGDVAAVPELLEHLSTQHLGVVHRHDRSLVQQLLHHIAGSRLAGVPSVLLEREPEDGDPLTGDGVEHRGHDLASKSRLLIVIHQHHLMPVVGHLLQSKGLADVHQVQDVLLKAGAAVSHRRLQELVSNTGIRTDSTRDLVDISIRLLAESGDGVDGGHTLGQECIRHQLGDL